MPLLESYIQMNMKSEMVQIQQNVVLNQTSRIEIQLLENSLSTNKLEKQLLMQTNEIHKLQNRNSLLESRVQQMETTHLMELEGIRMEKEQLQQLVTQQSDTIEGLEKSLQAANSNTSLLHQQQLQLLESVQNLAYCDMETDGGGWIVIQHRVNGSVSFQKSWKEYKQGFGDPAGEYWLGNEAVHLLTNQAVFSLRVELLDWEGHRAYALLFLKGYRGTAGQQSGLPLQGTGFSTRDADNDNCMCKCAQMLSGGWWFDACGLSNLNGIYYPARHNIRKLNGIRWHYFQGPGYSLKSTRMLIRPSRGREAA
ncbi:hypothetical protein JD844_019247 [Phrynosoma platyrhinos]|uniref:Fibrinogen C-terminal domain-containing protein n=1 Tax=Phrynosoma platyrhinos TaxID=52577 RepID=A0ABQ7SPM5_PHRPL|nr:hypothetical protein JD844_019247 [Phrynosoma platyrhinos]